MSDPVSSPKPNLPSPKAYEPPEPPSAKDLGPPPPGYGRYVDHERAGPAAPQNSSINPLRRNLDEVLCFKVSI
jgi:cleavage and polyadenylation specificity factor subunit 4